MTDLHLAARDEQFDLRHVIPEPAVAALGKVKARPRPVRPVLNLADYVAADVQPPPAVHRSHVEYPFGMLLNDQLGDCGEAMAIHGVEAFHLDACTPVPPFADPDAEWLYERVGGYVRGNPSTDQGTDNQTLVDFWRDHGIRCQADGSEHRIAGSLFVPHGDERVAKLAVWEFVVLFRALGLPLSAEGQPAWSLADPSLAGPAAVGSWGYHDIPYLSYDPRRLRNVTWGQELLVDWAFDAAYSVQGFVVVTQEQLSQRGMSPSGIDWARLESDFKAFPAADHG